ncbi:hypothetical protein [Nocardia sp. NPDC051463]|uniref:hypothetical protein n=1 Tax=Nocardia sp. NPDC051463 TaxID=3154845 RepID=UPI003450A1D4
MSEPDGKQRFGIRVKYKFRVGDRVHLDNTPTVWTVAVLYGDCYKLTTAAGGVRYASVGRASRMTRAIDD